MTPPVAALYVDPTGPYADVPDVELWDADKDARTYDGPHPVVAHPPCERWGRFARGRPENQIYKVGDDGGCFLHALRAVRHYGGLIEHPQGSLAWRHFNLPIPKRRRGWTPPDLCGGRSTRIDQAAYGHLAQKPTWLYAVLPTYPPLDWRRVPGTHTIGGLGAHSRRERQRLKARTNPKPKKPDLPKRLRHLTPPRMRDQFLDLANLCHGWRPPGPSQRQAQLPTHPRPRSD